MKKLSVFLAVCMVAVCASVSCRDNKDGSESLPAEISEMYTTPSFQDSTHEYVKDADISAFIGKWECTRLVADGEELTELRGIPAYAVFQYNILEDGSVKIPDSLMEIADADNPTTYKWGMISDTEIEITGSNGSAIVYKLAENGQLTNIDDKEEIYLDKVDDFKYFDFKGYYEKLLAQQNEQYVLTPVVTDENGEQVGTGEPIPVE